MKLFTSQRQLPGPHGPRVLSCPLTECFTAVLPEVFSIVSLPVWPHSQCQWEPRWIVQTYSQGQLLRCELVICLPGSTGVAFGGRGGSCCLGLTCAHDPLYFGFVRSWHSMCQEHSGGQPALAKAHMPEERKQEPVALTWGSRALSMPRRWQGLLW